MGILSNYWEYVDKVAPRLRLGHSTAPDVRSFVTRLETRGIP